MATITKGQNIKLHTLLAKLGISLEVKRDLVHQYTNGRGTSTKELYVDEAGDLISALEHQLTGKGVVPKGGFDADRKRKYLLHLAHLRGVTTPAGKVDVERVNQWCIKYGKYKKALMDHTTEELSLVIWQMEKVTTDFLNGI